MKTAGITLIVLSALLAVALGGVRFASARTAEAGCSFEAERRGFSSVGYSWSWSPPGTECTFDGRVSDTRLFW